MRKLTIFLFCGMLFFSCSLNDDGDYGTLVINLPGSGGARAAVSPEFTATLSYVVNCKGSGNVRGEFSYGDMISIPLNAGDWIVTVDVLNAARESIGQGTTSVAIEAGKTTTAPIIISIDTSRNRITNFAITGFINSVRSEIEDGDGVDNGSITVYFYVSSYEPTGNERITINITHTGVKVDPPSGTSLSLDEAKAFFENGVTVTAENNKTRTYIVLFEEEEQFQPGGAWPSPSVWQSFGLSGISQPAGTTVIMAGNFYGTLAVQLNNANSSSFYALITDIETALGLEGETIVYNGMYSYILEYSYSGKSYELVMSLGASTFSANTLTLGIETIESDSGESGKPDSYEWPDKETWESYGIPGGLSQPDGTKVSSVPVDMGYILSVEIENIDNEAYENLLNQIMTKLPEAYHYVYSVDERMDAFTNVDPSITVYLEMVEEYISIMIITS